VVNHHATDDPLVVNHHGTAQDECSFGNTNDDPLDGSCVWDDVAPSVVNHHGTAQDDCSFGNTNDEPLDGSCEWVGDSDINSGSGGPCIEYPIEDDVRTVSKSNNDSTHQATFRELSIAAEEAISAAVGQPQANSLLGLFVKAKEFFCSNEAYENKSLEEAAQSFFQAFSTSHAVAQIRPDNTSALAPRSAPRGSHSGRPQTKRLKSNNEIRRRGLSSSKPKAVSCAFCKGGEHKKDHCPKMFKINGAQARTLNWAETQKLFGDLGSDKSHKVYQVQKGNHERMVDFGFFAGEPTIPHGACHVILEKVYSGSLSFGETIDSKDNIVEATFLSEGGDEIENNAPGFYPAQTIRVWMTQNVKKSNKKYVFSKLEDPLQHTSLQLEYFE
jgi:hypothetical protein